MIEVGSETNNLREHNLFRDALHEWIVLVGCSHNLKLVPSLVNTDPDPPRSKDGSRSSLSFELCLHLLHGSKGLVDKSSQLVGWLCLLSLIRGSHFLPEEGVVVVTSSAIANGSSFQRIGHKIEDWNLILALRGLVDIGNIGSVVLVVVDLHRWGVNIRLKSFKRIWKIGNRVGVGGYRSDNSGTSGKRLAKDSTAACASV